MTGRSRRRAGLGVGMVLAVSVLAGCGSPPAAPAASSSAQGPAPRAQVAPDGYQVVTLHTQDDYTFKPDRFVVSPGNVRLKVVNDGTQLVHNFQFTPGGGPEELPDAQIPLLNPGDHEIVEFTVTTPGNYGFECSFHVQLGQTGTMIVSR